MSRRIISGALGRVPLFSKLLRKSTRSESVRLTPPGTPRGWCLLAHQIDGFLPRPSSLARRDHNQLYEAVAMAETLVEMGFATDVVACQRTHFSPSRRYDLVISHRDSFAAVTRSLDTDCVRVAYLDTTHWLYNNHASLARSLEVQRARGVTPERHIVIHPNRAIEDADHALLMGGEHAYETYAFAGTPVHEIVNLGRVDLPDPSGKDFSEAASHFIWIGSRGLAHKGLGRTLEAFARMPEMRLTVCGPIADEPRFAEAYRRELFETPNIRLYGWIDVTGPDFAALARSALGVVFPSCAEARSGGVINCMQAGLSPLISVETNVDVEPDFGVLLEDSSVGAIVAAVRALSARSPETLAAMAHATWRTARERYGREGYKRALRTALERIVAEGRHPTSRGFFRIPRADGAMAPLLDNP